MAHDNYENYNEEWKSCRETVTKFDNTLIDLRKYGFTIITGLLTAGSFLGFNEPTISLQVGVIIVTMTLIVILYWMDIYYQNLLYGSILRTNFLEVFRLERGLSFYISKLFGRAGMGAILHILYAGFLVAAFILGMFAAALSDNNSINLECNFPLKLCDSVSLLYISLGSGVLAMTIIFLFFDQVRSYNSKIIGRIIDIRKRDIDNLRGIALAAPKRINDIILQAEDEIHKILTKHIDRYELWTLTRIKDDGEFLSKLNSLT